MDRGMLIVVPITPKPFSLLVVICVMYIFSNPIMLNPSQILLDGNHGIHIVVE